MLSSTFRADFLEYLPDGNDFPTWPAKRYDHVPAGFPCLILTSCPLSEFSANNCTRHLPGWQKCTFAKYRELIYKGVSRGGAVRKRLKWRRTLKR